MSELWEWVIGRMILTEEEGSSLRNPVPLPFFYHKSHMDWPEIEL